MLTPVDGQRFVGGQGAGGQSRRRVDVGTFGNGVDGDAVGTSGGVGGRLQNRDVCIGRRTGHTGRTIEQLLGAELRVVRNTVDRVQGVADFGLVGSEGVGIVDAGVGRIQGQATHLHEQRVDLVESTFGGLHQRDGLLGVLDRLLEAGNLSTLLFGDDQRGGAIRTTVDLQAGRETLDRLRQVVRRTRQVLLGVQ